MIAPAPLPDLALLVPSWVISLRAARKSSSTLRTYTKGARSYLDWCTATGNPVALSRGGVNNWMADELSAGREAATVQSRLTGLRSFAAWLTEEGEIDDNPLLGLPRPKIDNKVVQPLTDDDIRLLLKTCASPAFRDRRDEALLRFMIETGIRAGEAIALKVDDVDLVAGKAIVRRGKGGKGRSVPFGPQTARALDRYIRLRRHHALADTRALWLGSRNNTFGYDGLHASLTKRAKAAGVEHFHPHLMRHTAAHRWLDKGGSEGGLMSVAGWARPDMLLRYTKARASDRAAAEARTLNLGDMG